MRSENPPEFVEMLLARLERVQADSRWAHQASGVRGSLIKALENRGTQTAAAEQSLRRLTEAAFQILLSAARNQSRQDSLVDAASPILHRASRRANWHEPEGAAGAAADFQAAP